VAGQESQVDPQGPSYGSIVPKYEKTKNGRGDPEQQVHDQALAEYPLEKINIHEFGTAHDYYGKLLKKDIHWDTMLLIVDEKAVFVDRRRWSPGIGRVDLYFGCWAIKPAGWLVLF
jgi:hypothetical protein